MLVQEVQEEVPLNIRSIVKDYHICCLEINVSELLAASKKRGECGNRFKVVNHSGQLGHLQSMPVDPLWPLHASEGMM